MSQPGYGLLVNAVTASFNTMEQMTEMSQRRMTGVDNLPVVNTLIKLRLCRFLFT